jgi:hypothetical protein
MVLSAIDLKRNVAAIASKIAADHKDTQDDRYTESATGKRS